SIAAGSAHTCALATAGGVWCWGRNLSWQLGNGSTTSSSTPVEPIGLTSGVASVSAGAAHTCAVTTAGGARCWGSDSDGQLGQGIETWSPADVVGGLVFGPPNAAPVAT